MTWTTWIVIGAVVALILTLIALWKGTDAVGQAENLSSRHEKHKNYPK